MVGQAKQWVVMEGRDLQVTGRVEEVCCAQDLVWELEGSMSKVVNDNGTTYWAHAENDVDDVHSCEKSG